MEKQELVNYYVIQPSYNNVISERNETRREKKKEMTTEHDHDHHPTFHDSLELLIASR